MRACPKQIDVIYRSEVQGEQLPEPLLAVVNFPRINRSPMTVETWTTEVDLARPERRAESGTGRDSSLSLAGNYLNRPLRDQELVARHDRNETVRVIFTLAPKYASTGIDIRPDVTVRVPAGTASPCRILRQAGIPSVVRAKNRTSGFLER
jgi:hypothetical protein